MKMRKILALLLTAAMCVGILAACGDGGETATPAPTTEAAATTEPPTPPPVVDDPVESGWVLSGDNPFDITIGVVTSRTAPSPGNRLEERMRAELGVTMIYDITPGDQQSEKIGIMLAGDTLPDLIAFSQQQDLLADGGAKLMMDDYLATGAYPNIYRHVEPVWGRLIWRGGGVPEGLYTLPNYNRFYADSEGNHNIGQGPHGGAQFAIQKDVLAWHGYPDLEGITPEECFRLVAEYLAEHPTIDGAPTIGYTIPYFGQDSWMIHNPPLFLMGGFNDGDTMIDPETGIATIWYTSDSAYRWYKLLNEMWHAGVIDREFHTHTEEMWKEKIANGRVLSMHHQGWHWNHESGVLRDAGKHERVMVATVPVWDDVEGPNYMDFPVMNVQQGWSVSVMAEEPERILTFFNTMLEEYWQIIMQWGEEGIDYTVGADGRFSSTQEWRDNRENLLWQQNNRLLALLDQMPKIQGYYPVNGNATSPDLDSAEWQIQLDEYDRNFLAAYGVENWNAFMYPDWDKIYPAPPYYPTWQAPLTPEADEADKLMEAWNKEQLPKLIMAPVDQFEALWEEYVAYFDRVDVAAFEQNYTDFAQMRMREATR